jgi:hypothetical protein
MGILLLALLGGGFTAPLDEVLIDQIPPLLGVVLFHILAVDLPLGCFIGISSHANALVGRIYPLRNGIQAPAP